MFNHQARWDRELPQDKRSLGAPIAVTCDFNKDRLIPRSFFWKNRTFHAEKVNFSWKDKQGKDTLYFFSVKTEGGTFEIVFSKENLTWHLRRLLAP